MIEIIIVQLFKKFLLKQNIKLEDSILFYKIH